MKVALILSCIALCSATSLYSSLKEVSVDGDRRVVIKCPGLIIIYAKPRNNENALKIIVKEHDKPIEYTFVDANKNVVRRTVLTDESKIREELSEDERKALTTGTLEESDSNRSETHYHTQMSAISDIFRKYRGIITDKTFCELIADLKSGADTGKFNHVVSSILESKCGICNSSGLLETGKFGNFESNYREDRPYRYPANLDSTAQNGLVYRLFPYQHSASSLRQEHDFDVRGDSYNNYELWGNPIIYSHSKPLEYQKLIRQSNIQDVQSEIIQLQLKVQRLQLHEQFLCDEKQKLNKKLVPTYRQGVFGEEARRNLENLEREEKNTLEEQLNVQLKIRSLQDEIIREERELEQELRAGSSRGDKYYL